MLVKTLTAWGFETRVTENFQDVTEEVLRFSPHLVLMDMTALLQWLLPLLGNTQGIKGPCCISVIGI